MRYTRHAGEDARPWVGSQVALPHPPVRGTIVDVIMDRTLHQITHAVVAFHLGDAVPVLYQPVQVTMLSQTRTAGCYTILATEETLAATPFLPDAVQYCPNIWSNRAAMYRPCSGRVH